MHRNRFYETLIDMTYGIFGVNRSCLRQKTSFILFPVPTAYFSKGEIKSLTLNFGRHHALCDKKIGMQVFIGEMI